MTAGNVSQVLRVPCRLVVNPTNLALAYPHGGTEVGLVRAVAITALGEPVAIHSEAYGEPTDLLEAPNRYAVACVIRGMDDDALEALQPLHYRRGAVSSRSVFDAPGTRVAGASGLARAVRLLFAADDPIGAPSVLIYRGVAGLGAQEPLRFTRNDELAWPIGVECFRDSAGRILSIGRLADLSLA